MQARINRAEARFWPLFLYEGIDAAGKQQQYVQFPLNIDSACLEIACINAMSE
jgi:hypothetical protein